MAVYGEHFRASEERGATSRGALARSATHVAGAVLSVALIVGIGLWGYRLAMRDAHGVPVVRALEGPMRVAPDDPGGETIAHQGLAVNAVAADDGAAPEPDTVVLAPAPVDIDPADATADAAAEGPRAGAVEQVRANGDALPDDEAGAALEVDLSQPPADDEDPVMAALAIAIGETPPAATSGPVHPEPRPASLSRSAPVAAPPADEVAPGSLAVGTRLVQLGAYDSAEEARAAWDGLAADFASYFTAKSRVVEPASGGGQAFFRLRAAGFDDDAAARRFCAVLIDAERDCIPVLVR